MEARVWINPGTKEAVARGVGCAVSRSSTRLAPEVKSSAMPQADAGIRKRHWSILIDHSRLRGAGQKREYAVAHLTSYSEKYPHVRFDREDGVLQMTLHLNGGPAKWSARTPGGIHEELGNAFYNVGHDADNRIAILTGTGDTFLTEFDDWKPSASDLNTDYWQRIYTEGIDLIQNLLAIEIPVIGAVNGPAFIHAELLTLSDLVVASERASFADKAHTVLGTVPGDGVHVWWPMLLGPNRGRQFLLSGEEITAVEAKQLGFVSEVVPHDRVIDRAWEIARQLAQKPRLTLRMTRVAVTQHIKRRMLDDLGYGLMLEGMGALNRVGK